MKQENWDLEILPRTRLWNLRLNEIWKYRDLIYLFVKRDFIAVYKQTILGPVWFFIQPILTTIIFTIIFGNYGKIGTDGIPPALFYLAGLTMWTYFADCLTKTSETFIKNQAVFGKVYFPRLVVPISIVISGLLKLTIQILLFLAFWSYYYFNGTITHFSAEYVLLVPILILTLSALGFSIGIIFSSMTTKYRDLNFLLAFGVQLCMYLSSVVVPLSQIPANFQVYFRLNPVVNVVESFRFIFTGQGAFSFAWLMYSLLVSIIMVLISIVIFNRVERSFMDTI